MNISTFLTSTAIYIGIMPFFSNENLYETIALTSTVLGTKLGTYLITKKDRTEMKRVEDEIVKHLREQEQNEKEG